MYEKKIILDWNIEKLTEALQISEEATKLYFKDGYRQAEQDLRQVLDDVEAALERYINIQDTEFEVVIGDADCDYEKTLEQSRQAYEGLHQALEKLRSIKV